MEKRCAAQAAFQPRRCFVELRGGECALCVKDEPEQSPVLHDRAALSIGPAAHVQAMPVDGAAAFYQVSVYRGGSQIDCRFPVILTRGRKRARDLAISRAKQLHPGGVADCLVRGDGSHEWWRVGRISVRIL